MSELRKVTIDEVVANRRRGGDIRVLLSPKTVESTSGFMGVLTLQPGEFVSEHYHPYSEEFIMVVRGSLLALIEREQEIRLGPGEALMIPKNLRHRVSNQGDTEAAAVFQLSPLAPRPELGHVDTEELPNPSEPVLRTGGPR